jgi:hypothetical protein
MNYATTYPIRNYQHADRKTTAIAPTVKRVHCGCKTKDANKYRRQRKAVPIACCQWFLKSFLPKLKTEQSVQACKKTVKQEDFINPFQTCRTLWIEPMQTKIWLSLQYSFGVCGI